MSFSKACLSTADSITGESFYSLRILCCIPSLGIAVTPQGGRPWPTLCLLEVKSLAALPALETTLKGCVSAVAPQAPLRPHLQLHWGPPLSPTSLLSPFHYRCLLRVIPVKILHAECIPKSVSWEFYRIFLVPWVILGMGVHGGIWKPHHSLAGWQWRLHHWREVGVDSPGQMVLEQLLQPPPAVRGMECQWKVTHQASATFPVLGSIIEMITIAPKKTYGCYWAKVIHLITAIWEDVTKMAT